ncbi:hypothetical protein [Streptomyces sp. NPDC052042]|uniref:hypothetical protein n=1 Tax=Streptomyces sp. NPDC052042 TaxID=3365683 RepID=UPI0037CD028B
MPRFSRSDSYTTKSPKLVEPNVFAARSRHVAAPISGSTHTYACAARWRSNWSNSSADDVSVG